MCVRAPLGVVSRGVGEGVGWCRRGVGAPYLSAATQNRRRNGGPVKNTHGGNAGVHDRRRDRGTTFVEILVSIVLLGTAVGATLTALRTTIVSSERDDGQAEAQAWLLAAEERASHRTPYYSCDDLGPGEDLLPGMDEGDIRFRVRESNQSCPTASGVGVGDDSDSPYGAVLGRNVGRRRTMGSRLPGRFIADSPVDTTRRHLRPEPRWSRGQDDPGGQEWRCESDYERDAGFTMLETDRRRAVGWRHRERHGRGRRGDPSKCSHD